ncbi:MAG: hypothetical protein H7A33_00585 [Deltaproteobacteria bacterium]|nr:hypothetical protein [Deltaproteobacteria bacterium]
MFKLIKLAFYLLAAVTLLYFFGDFRINDTHVQTYLRQHISIDRLVQLKSGAEKIYDGVHDIVIQPSANDKTQSLSQTQVNQTVQVQATQNSKPSATQQPLEHISNKERKQLKDIINSQSSQ